MTSKRLLSLVLAATMLVTTAAGCGAKDTSAPSSGAPTDSAPIAPENKTETFIEDGKTFNKTGTKISEDGLVLTGFGSKYSGNAEWNSDMLLWKELEARTGIKIEWETVENAEARTKALTLFAADDLPDVLGKNALNMVDVTKFGTSNQLVDFAPFMEAGLMPNFKKLYDEDVNVRIACTDADGKIFSLPSVYLAPIETTRRFMHINETWLKNVGMEKPTTIEELLNVLRAFKEKDANGNGDPKDEYPMSLGDAIAQTERTVRGLAGIDNVFDQPYNIVDGELKQMYTSENMKNAFKFLNTCYTEGLVEPDIFTRKAPEFFARLSNDQYGVTLLLPPADSSQFGILEPTFGLDGKGTAIWNWNVSPVLAASTFNITTANKYPQATARYMDYFYSEEGATLVRMGVEGETYVVNADGSYSYSDTIKNDPQGVEFAMAQHSFWLGPNTTPGRYTDKMCMPLYEGTIKVDCPAVFEKYLTPHAYSMPQLEATLNKERTTLQDELNKYYSECRAAFMTGKMNIDTQWDEYVQTMEKLKVARLEEIYQIAYGMVKDQMK